MKLKPALFIAAILIVFVGLPMWQFVFPEEQKEVAREEGVLVQTEIVSTGLFEETLRYPGTISPRNTTVVTPKLAGEILEVHVDENQLVQAGDLLVSLDDSRARLQVEQARAGVRASRAQLEQARRGVRVQELESARASVEQAEQELQTARSNLERTERLFEAGTIPRSDYEQAQDRFQSARTEVENARRSLRIMEEGASAEELELAEANLESSQKQLELAELQLDYAEVRAPIDGRIADVMADEGNMASTSTSLAAIISDELINVTTALPEEHYGTIAYRTGELAVRVFPIAYPDDPAYNGVVSSVSSVIQSESRTFEVEIAVDNPGGRLRPGMFVNLELIIRSVEDAITVPASAVLVRDGHQVVYVIDKEQADSEDDGITARLQRVSVGERNGSRLHITDGLEPGMELVVEGNAYLEDGQLVRLYESEQPESEEQES